MKKPYWNGKYTQVNPNFGIVETEDDQSFFVHKKFRNNAFDGDYVKIEMTRPEKDGKKPEARIISILERTTKALVGRFIMRKGAKYGFVQIVEGFFWKDVFVAEKDRNGAENDDMVAVRIFGEKDKPYGVIKEIIGRKGDPGIEEKIILLENNIKKEFPEKVIGEARALKRVEEAGRRTDLRNEWIVTIDGEDAKDLDDAIGVKKLSNGNFELGVHIADVAHYVREGTDLDREALRRGTSIYLPDAVIPMLPEKISNDLCSLNAHTPKATLSIFMEIDKKGNVLDRRIEETLIESKKRFTYNEVQQLIDSIDGKKHTDKSSEKLVSAMSEASMWVPHFSRRLEERTRVEVERDDDENFLKKEAPKTQEAYPHEIMEMIRNALELKRILDDRRSKEGKIEFDFPEIKIIIGKDGKVQSIGKRDRNEAHKVIEEFMIIANEEVSRFFAIKKIPFLYRIHEKPSEENLAKLDNILKFYGYDIDIAHLSPLDLRKVMDTLHEKEYRYVLSKNILTSMSKAAYSEESLGHFGLSLRYYSHFTSPIRRYPDLQIHRIIKEFLHGKLDQKKIKHFQDLLPKVAKTTSSAERKAEDIEYAIRDVKIIEYMQNHVWETFEGTIASLTEHGIYVELENGIEGCVYIKNLSENFIIDDETGTMKQLSGWTSFRLGTNVMVKVVKADKTLRRLDFAFVE